MPATAGRVRMPHNNRMSSSAALKMTGIWTQTIGYDPYAADTAAASKDDRQDAYEQAKGLMKLAKESNKGITEQRGACKKCGMVGHLTFQCRNHLQAPEEPDPDSDSSSDEDDNVVVSDVSLSDDSSDQGTSYSKKRKATPVHSSHVSDRSTKRARSRSRSRSPAHRSSRKTDTQPPANAEKSRKEAKKSKKHKTHKAKKSSRDKKSKKHKSRKH